MRLADLLPGFYALGRETSAIQDAFGPELTAAQVARDDCFLQIDVNTATWGLDLWEEAYGISTEAGKSPDYRRTRLLSKMRGSGTTTAALVRNVAESFSNGEVEVIEHPAEYRFDIRFVGSLGVPPNMDDLTAAIEESKPAHLGVGYVFVWRTWAQVGVYPWGELAAHTWDEVLGGELN